VKQTLLRSASALAIGAAMAAPVVVSASAEESSVWAEVFANGSTVTGNTAIDNGAVRVNEIVGSYDGASGIVEVQQNNGSSNNIGAATAVHVDIAGNQNVTAQAIANPTSFDNFTLATGSDRRNDIIDSFNNFSGVVTVQQNNGDNNEIGAATAVHSSTGTVGDVVQNAIANATSHTQSGSVSDDLVDSTNVRSNVIDPSFTNASGVMTVQQNNGNANAMGIATSVVANTGAGSLTQNAQASANVFGNLVDDLSASRDNMIIQSFNGGSGVATVQQNNGDANAMAVATAFAVNLGTETGDAASIDGQTATVTQGGDSVLITAADTRAVDGTRDTVVDNSFTGFQGIATVQQNNGNNNVMAEAIAIKVDLQTTGMDDDSETVLQTTASSNGELPRVAIENAAAAGANDRDNKVIDGFNGQAAGILKVQQNNGDNSYQGVSNTIDALIEGDEDIDTVTASSAGTEASITEAKADDTGANRANLIDPSFVDAQGLVTVQQNNGNNSVMLGSNAVVANINNVEDDASGIENGASGLADVIGNVATMTEFSDRTNSVADGSFNGARGIITVQQNNGDNAIIAAANAAAVNEGGAFGSSLSTSSLGATVSGNTTTVAPTVETGLANTVAMSFQNVAGIVVVQQNNGNNSAVQSAISMVANY